MTDRSDERGPESARFPDFSAPSIAKLLKESRVLFDVARAPLSTPQMLAAPRGDGRAMIVLPGLGASDRSLLPLRGYLATRSHDVTGWGLGRNNGDVKRLLEQFVPSLEQRVERSGRSANLAGWSLGGVVAREATRLRPDLVDKVATFGTPLFGPRASRPLPRPVMAIHSRNDGVVDWRACIDDVTPFALNVEVTATHFGMGLSPDVMIHLARWFAA